MPFFRHAEVSLTSTATPGSEPQTISYQVRRANRAPSRASALFGAQRWIDDETLIGVDIPLLSLRGEGKWVGLFADLGSVNTARRSYLEGDERIFFDDSFHPEVYGTGTEDFFNGGFYFDQGPFRLALHGSPYHHLLANGEDATAAYRLMLTDGISFSSSLSAGLLPLTVNRNGELEFTITALARPGTLSSDDSIFTAFAYELWIEVPPQLFADGFLPTAVNATGGIFSDRVRVTFNPVAGAAVYRVFRCLDVDQACGPPIGFPKTGIFDDKKAIPGQLYYYRVRACTSTACGEFSSADQGFIGIGTRPDTPLDVNATDGSYSDRVQLTWTAVSNATVYRVFRCVDTGRTCSPPIGFPKSDIFEDSGGKPGTIYFYRLRACTSTHCSNFSVGDSGYRALGVSPATK